MATIKSVSTLLVDGDWIESKDQSLEGIRLIQTGNIGIGEYLDKTNRAKYISEETLERLNCTELMSGDILISRLPDPIGRACRVPNNIGRAITAVDCTIIRLNPDKCDAEYFVQYTQSKMYQNRLSQFFAGSTRTRISRKNLEQVEIPLPSIAEQRHIALTLGKVDNLIALRREQLAKLDELVKARFVELFECGNYRFFRLGDVCTKITDGTHKTPNYLDSGVTFISAKNIVNGELDFTDVKYISDQEYAEIQKRCQTEMGDILLSKSGSLGAPVIVKTADKIGLFESLAVIKYDRHRLLAAFLCEQLKSDNVQRQFKVGTKGVAIKHLHLGVIADTEIIVPPIEEQLAFVGFVEQTNKTKLTIQSSLDKLEVMKKALMQEYFG